MAHSKSLKYFTLTAVLAFHVFCLPIVNAQDGPLGEQAASSLQALEMTNNYSFQTGGVGILIGYGKNNGDGVTALVIGDQFVRELDRRGIQSKYFFYHANWEGMTVEYHIGYSALGPWSVQEAASNISKAVERAIAAENVNSQ